MAAILSLTPSAPSISLPPLRCLQTYSPAILSLHVRNLMLLYHPASTSASAHALIDSGYSSAPRSRSSTEEEKEAVTLADDEEQDEWIRLRGDEFERALALRWLTGLVARGDEWASVASEDSDIEDKEKVIEDAATLLGACSRTSEAGALRREYVFPVGKEGRQSVTVYTRDESYTGEDHTAVGVQTWASSAILAELMARDPSSYGLPFPFPSATSSRTTPFRILELGAGTGLLSLFLSALSSLPSPCPQPTEIISTDYHTTVLSLLRANLLSNFPSQPPYLCLSAHFLDWSDTTSPLSPPFDNPFDMLIGADIIYEPAHCAWIYTTAQRLLARPHGVFHLIMPLRPTHAAEYAIVREVFPFAETVLRARVGEEKEKVLAVTEVRELERSAGKGRADEIRYEIFRMEWV